MRLLSTIWVTLALLANQARAEGDFAALLNCTFTQIFSTKDDMPIREVSLIMKSDGQNLWHEDGRDFEATFIPAAINHGGQNSVIAYRDLSSTDSLILLGGCMARDCYSEAFTVENGTVASMTSQTIGYGEFIISAYTGTCVFAEALN